MKFFFVSLMLVKSIAAFSVEADNSKLGYPTAPMSSSVTAGYPYANTLCIENLRNFFPDLKIDSNRSVDSMIFSSYSGNAKVNIYTTKGSVEVDGINCKKTEDKQNKIFEILGSKLSNADSEKTIELKQQIKDLKKGMMNRSDVKAAGELNKQLNDLNKQLSDQNDLDVEQHIYLDESCRNASDDRLRKLADADTTVTNPAAPAKDNQPQ